MIARGIAGKLGRKVPETVGPTASRVCWFLARNFVARLRTRDPKGGRVGQAGLPIPQLVIGKASFFCIQRWGQARMYLAGISRESITAGRLADARDLKPKVLQDRLATLDLGTVASKNKEAGKCLPFAEPTFQGIKT